MPEIPIIGQSKPADTQPSLADLTDEERERLAALADLAEDAESVATAFLLILHHDGRWEISVPDRDLTLARPATDDDVVAGAAVATQNCAVAKTANAAAIGVVQIMQAQMQRVAQAQQDAALMNKVRPNLRG